MSVPYSVAPVASGGEFCPFQTKGVGERLVKINNNIANKRF